MDERLLLADGTEVYNAYVVQLEGAIAIYINEHTAFADLYETFANPNRTEHIHSFQYGDEKDWYGYTVPYAMEEREDSATVCLRRDTEDAVG